MSASSRRPTARSAPLSPDRLEPGQEPPSCLTALSSPANAQHFAIAALRLFHAEGDRVNRSRARLRHVRERMGDAAFLQRLNDLFKEELRGGDGPAPDRPPVSAQAKLVCRLRPPLGDLAPALARELASAVEAVGGDMRIGLEHDLLVHGNEPPALTPSLRPMTAEPCIVPCPGVTWCSRAIADSRGTAASIRAALPADCALAVSISGCPNNCSHASVADIGLVARIRTVNGVRQECYRLLAGGGAGRTAILANELHPCVPATEVPATVRTDSGRIRPVLRRTRGVFRRIRFAGEGSAFRVHRVAPPGGCVVVTSPPRVHLAARMSHDALPLRPGIYHRPFRSRLPSSALS